MKLSAGIFAASIAMAQLSPPNSSGVAMGHLHYTVQNVEANKKFWVALGGVATKIGSTEAVRFPDVMVLLSPGTASEGTEGSVVNHVAFRVQSLAAIAAAGLRWRDEQGLAGLGLCVHSRGRAYRTIRQHSHQRALYLRRSARPGCRSSQSQNHRARDHASHPPVCPHGRGAESQGLVHDAPLEACRASAGTTRPWTCRESTSILPSLRSRAAPTKGRRLDHIGLEVRNLAAFCKKLEASGIHFDEP